MKNILEQLQRNPSPCGSLTKGGVYDCAAPIVAGSKARLILIDKDIFDQAVITRNGTVITNIALTTGSGFLFEGIKRSVNPQSALVPQSVSVGFDHQLTFQVFDIDQKQKDNLEKLALNSMVAIIGNINTPGNIDAIFEVMGADVGMELQAGAMRINNDLETNSSYTIDLKTSDDAGKEGALPVSYWDGDYQSTKDKIENLLITAEAQAVLDRMVGLTTIEKDAIVRYVNDEVSDDNWNLIDEFYCFSLGGVNNLTGFKAKTAINFGATFSLNGATFDGAGQYINTNFTPSVDGVNFSLNNGFAGAFVKEILNINADEYSIYGGRTSIDRTGITNLVNTASIRANVNSDSATVSATINSNTLYVTERVASDESGLRTNGNAAGSSSSPSTSVTAEPIYVGARNQSGTAGLFFNGTVSTFIIGAAIGFDHIAHNINVRRLLTNLGVTL